MSAYWNSFQNCCRTGGFNASCLYWLIDSLHGDGEWDRNAAFLCV